jgi:hypothetical protein
MTREQLDKRQERAARETFVIKKTDEGYRVYAPGDPARNYLVAGSVDQPTCTCPDFEHHSQDPDWRCKHILAILNRANGNGREAQQHDPVEHEERLAIREEARRTANNSGPSQMVLKRSVSPDGRIDSLSVELSCPVENRPAPEVARQARRALELQSEIVDGFLGRNGSGNGDREATNDEGRHAVEARMLRIGGLDTRYGRRLYINVQVNGNTLKLFGSPKQLADAIESAGFPDRTNRVEEGVKLDLPCRVTTKQSEDGRYVNVDEVFPAPRSIQKRSGR